MRRGVDVIVACPGRLEDLIQQGHVSLGSVEVTIIDEADHMADLGFLPAVRRLLDATPQRGQRMLFSATLDAGIGVIVKRYLHDPKTHEADSAQSPISTMAHHVLHVTPDTHLPVLLDLVAAPGRTVVFTRTKHRAKKLSRQLNSEGVPAVELHGNLSQNARTRTMEAFHSGEARTLVATDIAARGIHVDDVALVIHADPPVEHKAYLHRSGRTARAGASGTVITLMTDDQVRDVRDLTRKAGVRATTTRITPSCVSSPPVSAPSRAGMPLPSRPRRPGRVSAPATAGATAVAVAPVAAAVPLPPAAAPVRAAATSPASAAAARARHPVHRACATPARARHPAVRASAPAVRVRHPAVSVARDPARAAPAPLARHAPRRRSRSPRAAAAPADPLTRPTYCATATLLAPLRGLGRGCGAIGRGGVTTGRGPEPASPVLSAPRRADRPRRPRSPSARSRPTWRCSRRSTRCRCAPCRR